MPYTSTQCCLITELDGVRLPEVYVTACETEFPVKIEYSDAKKDNGVKEVRMQYIQKCYDDIVQLKRMFHVLLGTLHYYSSVTIVLSFYSQQQAQLPQRKSAAAISSSSFCTHIYH